MNKQRQHVLVWPLVALLAIGALVIISVSAQSTSGASFAKPSFTLNVDPGTPISGGAHDFTLTDQSGAKVSLHSYRGKVVILAFSDSECTTVCPLTTTTMVDAKRMLGAKAKNVALLGVDANPNATSIKAVRAYSEVHGMVHRWRFLTGPLPALRRVWHEYHILVAVEHGQIDHTAALFVINPRGALTKVYLTQMSYSSVQQQARLLADESAGLLPGHPRVQSHVSFAAIPTVPPTARVSLPRSGGGTVALGPGRGPRLYLFFASWDSEVTDLAAQLVRLGRYESAASARGLPALVAVDEASVEPSPSGLPRFLTTLGRPLAYPVAVDASGRVADGYGVQDEPWYVLVSAAGRVLWYFDASTSGWPATSALLTQVKAALARPAVPTGAAAVGADLAGSPPSLAAIHAQSGRLLGGLTAFQARLRALRGHPVVVNAWASSCTPCRAEFGLFAAASALYGRRVAFVGLDTGDSPADARAFLAQHPVSYPSYQSPNAAADSVLTAIEGLPTTVFISPAGKVVHVHTGQYASQGTLDSDVTSYTGAT